MGRADPCRHHRAALLDFLEQREHGPATAAALAHLDRCRGCEDELGATLLTIHALRRVLGEAARADPPADAWDRLRTRVQRPVAGVWQARTAVAGLAVSAALVTALVGPAAVFRPESVVEEEPGPPAAVLYARTVADQRAESAFLSRPRVVRPTSPTVPVVDGVPAQWQGPDGLGGPQARPATPIRTGTDQVASGRRNVRGGGAR